MGILLLFAIGEGANPFQFNLRDGLLFCFFPVGVCLGMIAAWRWEGAGAGVTVGSLAGFYLVHRLFSPGFPRGLAFAVIASPAVLFVGCWFWTRWRAQPSAD